MNAEPAISRWILVASGGFAIVLGTVATGVPVFAAVSEVLAEFGRGNYWISSIGFNDSELTGWRMWGFFGAVFLIGIGLGIGGVWLVCEGMRSAA